METIASASPVDDSHKRMAAIEFAVLGPLEIRGGGRLVNVGAPKRRALVAVLLLNANRVVSMDRLVDALWGSEPPASARAQVQSLVHGVRSALAAVGAQALLETHPPGYVIRIDPDQLDLTAFERRVDEARKAATTGRLAEAADSYRAALGLWRGPALGGIDAPFAPAHVDRLEEQRLGVLEERVEVDLRLGRHALLTSELVTLVAEHPFREKLRVQLMLALYRCGRQADALAVYRQARRLLVEELGLEPGPTLRDMEQAVLAWDPSLDAEPPVPARATAPGPADDARVDTPSRPSAGPPGRGRLRARVLGLALGVIALLAMALLVTGDRHTSVSREPRNTQVFLGPTWVRQPEVVPPTLFGVTLNSSSGTMPSFRVGAVRLWDSRTRWANVQPRRGQFDWTILDRLVAGAEQAGLPVLYTIGGTPAWANPEGAEAAYDDGSRTAPPRDLADWDAFVRAIARRYRGRIEAYELWNLANSPRFYTGSLQTLVEMTRRASRLIKAIDPHAIVVCPSMGELWKPAMRDFLRRFAAAGGYRHCDVAAVKLHQRHAADKPETMVALAGEIDRAFHRGGAHKRLWNTGSTYNIALEPQVAQADAANFAVRFYLVGLYIKYLFYERMYFYNWGGEKIPLVLQVEGGPPTQAASFIEELERWLIDARIRSCGSGTRANLPANVWQCQFTLLNDHGGREDAVIRWTVSGHADITAEPRAYRLQHLDGRSQLIRPGVRVRVSERPILMRYRSQIPLSSRQERAPRADRPRE